MSFPIICWYSSCVFYVCSLYIIDTDSMYVRYTSVAVSVNWIDCKVYHVAYMGIRVEADMGIT